MPYNAPYGIQERKGEKTGDLERGLSLTRDRSRTKEGAHHKNMIIF
jgi:hypothetical protein